MVPLASRFHPFLSRHRRESGFKQAPAKPIRLGMAARVLARRASRHGEIRALLLLASLCLGLGLYFPVMAVRKLGFWTDDYSILRSLEELIDGGDVFIATVIAVFVVVLPVGKLLLLSVMWYLPVSGRRRDRALRGIHHLTRWSMLDIFVVAVLLIMTQANPVVSVKAGLGLYFFTAGILLSLILTFRMDQLHRRYERRRWRR